MSSFKCEKNILIQSSSKDISHPWKQYEMERETGLETCLLLKIGARVMITTNLGQPNEVVNGAMATATAVSSKAIAVRIAKSRKLVRVPDTPKKLLKEIKCGFSSLSPLLIFSPSTESSHVPLIKSFSTSARRPQEVEHMLQ